MSLKMRRSPIEVGGFVPLTTIDFPDALACVVFCQGCPWRCRYCHNAHLQEFRCSEKESQTGWDSLMKFLEKRRGLLDAVVFSGGEPTAQPKLLEAIKIVRNLGFKVGLHTAGMFSRRLEKLIPFIDWVGLDIKAPLNDIYRKITDSEVDLLEIQKSLRLLIRSGVSYQIRTTVDPLFLKKSDICEIQEMLRREGALASVLQAYRVSQRSP